MPDLSAKEHPSDGNGPLHVWLVSFTFSHFFFFYLKLIVFLPLKYAHPMDFLHIEFEHPTIQNVGNQQILSSIDGKILTNCD
jgi:hypothetical protein